MTSGDVLDLLGIEISPARMKCALLSLETLQGALGARAGAEPHAARAAPARRRHDAPPDATGWAAAGVSSPA